MRTRVALVAALAFAVGLAGVVRAAPNDEIVTEVQSGVATLAPADERLLDTRVGATTGDGRFAALGQVAARDTIEVDVIGRAGHQGDSGTFLLNLTIVDPSGPGFATVFDCAAPRPDTASITYDTGELISNLTITKVNGPICVFTSAATDLILDSGGHVVDVDTFENIPRRVADSRVGLGLTRLTAGSPRPIAIDGSAPFDLMAMVVTATGPAADGWLGFVACPPVVAAPELVLDRATPSVVFAAGSTRSNMALIEAPSAVVTVTDQLCIVSTTDTDVVVDLQGRFASGTIEFGGGRAHDSRTSQSTALAAGARTEVELARGDPGPGGYDAPQQHFVNLTVVDAGANGFIKLGGCNDAEPTATATATFTRGVVTSHLSAVELEAGELLCAFSTADADIVIDRVGAALAPSAMTFAVSDGCVLQNSPQGERLVHIATQPPDSDELTFPTPGRSTIEMFDGQPPYTVSVENKAGLDLSLRQPEPGAGDATILDVEVGTAGAGSHRLDVSVTDAAGATQTGWVTVNASASAASPRTC